MQTAFCRGEIQDRKQERPGFMKYVSVDGSSISLSRSFWNELLLPYSVGDFLVSFKIEHEIVTLASRTRCPSPQSGEGLV
jgi:hypothetical protein